MELHRFAFHAMASDHELLLWCDEAARAAAAADAAIVDVRRIEAKYSRYRDDSVTSRINQAAGGAPVAIDAETASLLRYADLCHAMSGGLFDITSGVLRRAWDFKRTPPELPDAATLASALALVGWRDVERSETTIRLPRAGMEIDFGGIGKEYAADRAATILVEHGVAHALVNLGGDVRIAGPQADGAPWRVGIKHPRAPGGVIASVALSAGAIATSGDYERYFEIGGHRFCHLLDPHTGYPVEHLQSVSVIAPLCVVAGSLATIAMLCADKGCAFLDAQRVDYLAVAPDGTLRGPALQQLAATDKVSVATRT
jgi:thiamine biosynthesis lipoprotein